MKRVSAVCVGMGVDERVRVEERGEDGKEEKKRRKKKKKRKDDEEVEVVGREEGRKR